eukprot:3819093-Pleurochrysis_carterae.AAC.1
MRRIILRRMISATFIAPCFSYAFRTRLGQTILVASPSVPALLAHSSCVSQFRHIGAIKQFAMLPQCKIVSRSIMHDLSTISE